jgi:enoyl-CoA hydratase/carnithine racemase
VGVRLAEPRDRRLYRSEAGGTRAARTMADAPTDEVRITIDDTVATITLARPDRRNRLTKTMLEAVLAQCTALRDDLDVRAIVVRGEGRDFSTGVDLADPGMRAMATEPIGRRRRTLLLGPRVVEAIQALPQTTIAAMHGYCLGGGGCLALACDLRVAAADLRFGMPEVLRGMNMSWRTVPLMVAHFGPARTKELLITGRHVDADEAIVWGLANRIVAAGAEAVRAEATAWAQEIARTVPPIAASMVKQTVNAVANANTALVHMDTDQYILAQMTDDFREAVSAFLDKRDPEYKGR